MATNNNNDNDEFRKWAKASRSAGADDTVVELMKPLGLVLNQDDKGNVYVETVAPKGNAARTGLVSYCKNKLVVFPGVLVCSCCWT